MAQTDQIADAPPPSMAAVATDADVVPGPRSGFAARAGNKTALLVIACVAQFMVVLDVSIVNVALPAMRGALDLSPTGVQWVVNAYALGFAGLLLFGGRAADLFGAKPVFLTGLIGFTAASLAGGMADTGGLLIAARSVQGLAGAVLAPATMTLIMTTFTDPRERTKALGAWSATMAAGGAMGAVVGGMLTQWVSWRWVLFVNVPIGAALILAAVPLIAKTRGRGATLRTLDLPGAITVTLGLTGIVYGVVTTDTHSWGSGAVLAPMAAGVVLLAAFVWLEARSRHALVPLRVFRNRSLAVADVAALLIGAGMFAMWFYVSLYLQQVLGFDALQAGFAFVPGSAMIVLGTMLATRALAKIGPRPLLLTGPFVAAAGLAWLSRFPADGSYTADVLGPLMLLTFGMGLAMTPAGRGRHRGHAPARGGPGLRPDQHLPAGRRRHRPGRPVHGLRARCRQPRRQPEGSSGRGLRRRDGRRGDRAGRRRTRRGPAAASRERARQGIGAT